LTPAGKTATGYKKGLLSVIFEQATARMSIVSRQRIGAAGGFGRTG
jgi:hypothetical protein